MPARLVKWRPANHQMQEMWKGREYHMIAGEDMLIENRQAEHIRHLKERCEKAMALGFEQGEAFAYRELRSRLNRLEEIEMAAQRFIDISGDAYLSGPDADAWNALSEAVKDD